jgi:prophage antirepressor-like protein
MHSVRVVFIDEAPWFVAADVCRCLGLPVNRGVYQHVSKLHEAEKTFSPNLIRGKGMARTTLVSESGLYRLIFRSDKPEARRFQDWVFTQVLPAIRKDGAYIVDEEKVRAGDLPVEALLQIVSEKLTKIVQERDQLAVEKARLAA